MANTKQAKTRERASELLDYITFTDRANIPRTRAFQNFANTHNIKCETVRNSYYNTVKELNLQDTFKIKKCNRFSDCELSNIMSKLVKEVNKVKSVRLACYNLSNGDAKLMLRLQNKFRSVFNNNPVYLENLGLNYTEFCKNKKIKNPKNNTQNCTNLDVKKVQNFIKLNKNSKDKIINNSVKNSNIPAKICNIDAKNCNIPAKNKQFKNLSNLDNCKGNANFIDNENCLKTSEANKKKFQNTIKFFDENCTQLTKEFADKKSFSNAKEFANKKSSLDSNTFIDEMVSRGENDCDNGYKTSESDARILRMPKSQKLTDEDITNLFMGLVKMVRRHAIENAPKTLQDECRIASLSFKETLAKLGASTRKLEILKCENLELKSQLDESKKKLEITRCEFAELINKIDKTGRIEDLKLFLKNYKGVNGFEKLNGN